ncbi:MAG: FAD-dependent monooxygenase [Planctomycetota bacterium]
MSALSEARVAVVGGSYAGLCAGLALRCAGVDVHVYERTPDHNRIGGGIVVQPDFADYLEAFGYARPETVAIPTVGRKILDRDGSVARYAKDATFFTAWDTVLRSLQRAFDADRLHNDKSLDTIRITGDGVTLSFTDGGRVEADMLLGADGIGSRVRRHLAPEIAPAYAGYVGYRGILPESELSSDQISLFHDHFVMYAYPNSHILSYFIPGERGEREQGARRFNWVWYVSQTPEELRSILTDRHGVHHHASLGHGQMADEWVESLKHRATELLPPLVADVVDRTHEPFVQAIFDLQVPKMVYGRAALLGDAAFLVRPHTASGASKAAADAVALAHTLREAGRLSTEALEQWEADRMAATQLIINHGKLIAARGGLGR